MDKAEALAYVSRLFDAAQAGAAVWGDALLIKRFITQCSRTDSEATRAAYRNVSQKRLGGLVLDKFQPNVAVAVPCNLQTAPHRDACRSASFSRH